MDDSVKRELANFLQGVMQRNPGKAEFHQAVREVRETLTPFVLENQNYRDASILEGIAEPNQAIIIPSHLGRRSRRDSNQSPLAWAFNNAIGPYKGGLHFHPNVNQSVLKFLGFG